MPKVFRLFLDTSTLLSGLNSSTGASGTMISYFKAGKVEAYISPEVIEETKRNIISKFTLLDEAFKEFMLLPPKLTNEVNAEDLKKAFEIIQTEDTPILAGALKAKCNYIVTLDKKFQKIGNEKLSNTDKKLRLLSPSECLHLLRD